ncbi:MAG: hypothetical protein ACI8Z1_002998 [Candidatus Azotimanducaceae bacterium]|jgi:hypothetical protein
MAPEVESLKEASGIELKGHFDDTEDWFVIVIDDAELIVYFNERAFPRVNLSGPEGAMMLDRIERKPKKIKARRLFITTLIKAPCL